MAKYNSFGTIPISNRQWPNALITKAPAWCSVDLRDGNQALPTPMSVEKKLKFFDLLVRVGFKEIEVGFPSASQTEYDFLRRLIDEKRIPHDVTVQVLCQARESLVKRTLECLNGAPSAIFHMYNSTSPAQRKYTFNMTKEQIRAVAVEGVMCVKKYVHLAGNTSIQLEYSPESFSSTEIDFALEICEDVKTAWGQVGEKKLILNLPSTVETATPNVYADQIEYFVRNISNRDSVIISLHTHNDRGTGVAAAELGLLAGADRLEGTLFGNGERTGNLDILTMALNMYTQGIDSLLDFSHVGEIIDIYEKSTGMDVHRRHPYAGELVFTAFSGSHQDAIRKGMAARKAMAKDAPWDVPYLPIDPHDIGREYEEIIRINSQSGKGGAAWILEEEYGIFMPKAMHSGLGAFVTESADKAQRELTAAEIYQLFVDTWISSKTPLEIVDMTETYVDATQVQCRASIIWSGKMYTVGSRGNGPLDAFVQILRTIPEIPNFSISNFHEHSVGSGSGTDALAYVEVMLEDGNSYWGCGRSSNIGRAGIDGVVSAINRIDKQ